MSNDHDIKQEIYNGLTSENFADRFRAVQNLHQLQGDEPLKAIEQILKLESNLGMKLTALSVITVLINPEYYEYISNILEQAINDTDSEIIRNSLLILQKIPPEIASENLKRCVFHVLNAKDTDLQYQAILTLLYLRDYISHEMLTEAIEPITKHSNETLSNEAKKAIQTLSSSNKQ